MKLYLGYYFYTDKIQGYKLIEALDSESAKQILKKWTSKNINKDCLLIINEMLK